MGNLIQTLVVQWESWLGCPCLYWTNAFENTVVSKQRLVQLIPAQRLQYLSALSFVKYFNTENFLMSILSKCSWKYCCEPPCVHRSGTCSIACASFVPSPPTVVDPHGCGCAAIAQFAGLELDPKLSWIKQIFLFDLIKKFSKSFFLEIHLYMHVFWPNF